MKKQLFSLALSLALCLGLTVPVIAADASGLDGNTKKVYYDVLTAEINQYGIVTKSGGLGLEYAALEDMDADGAPELIVIRYGLDEGTAYVNVWTMRGGKAVRAVDEEVLAGGVLSEAKIFLVRRPGKTAVCSSFEWYERAYEDVDGGAPPPDFLLYYADGTTETISTAWTAFRNTWAMDDLQFSGGISLWLHNDKATEAVRQLQAALGSQANENGTAFADVKAGAYYYDAVKWAVDNKITSGTTATTFSPDQTCTVAQILTFIWRANGSPEPTAANPFTDIKTSDYYYKAALWAAEKGLVTGNRLNPNAPCTRAMTMEYMWKEAGRPTAQSEDYKPFTITTETWDGNTCVIAFDAALVKQSTVRLCEDYFGFGAEIDHTEWDEPGMLITVPSGSRVKIDNPGGADFPWGADGVDSKRFYSDNAGVFHSDPGVSSETLSSGDVIKDNVIVRFYANGITYLLTASSASPAFADVPANAEHAQAVAWAVENGITSGTGNGQFSPDTTCNRGQIMTFLYRAMGK